MGADIREFVAHDLWLLIGIVTFALISLAGIAGLEGVAGVLSIVGWFLLAPIFLFWGEEIAAAVFDERRPKPTARERDPGTDDDAIAELKRRYAAGKIDDAEFERRLDRLLAVDDALEDAFDSRPEAARSERAANDAGAESRDRERNLER